MGQKLNRKKIEKYINQYNYEVLYCKHDKNKYKWKLILMCPNFHIFKMDFDKFQNNRRCPYCNGSKCNEDFVREYMLNNGDILLSHYHNGNEKLKVMCKYGHIFYPIFNNYYNKNSRCPYCNGNITMEHESFINRLNIINPNIEILGEYKNSHTKIKCKCKIDRYEWEAEPTNLLGSKNAKPTGCPKCYRRTYRGETHPLFDHSKTKEDREDDRSYFEYNEWRTKCFERDKYTCQVTGQQGGRLVVHHLYSYNKYKCLRTVLENGITISEEIHKKFHSIYGNGNNTFEQWEEFIKSLK